MADREALEAQVREMMMGNAEDSQRLGALHYERAQYLRRVDRDAEVIVDRLTQRETSLRAVQVQLAQAEAEVARAGLVLAGRAAAAESEPPPAAHGEEAAQ